MSRQPHLLKRWLRVIGSWLRINCSIHPYKVLIICIRILCFCWVLFRCYSLILREIMRWSEVNRLRLVRIGIGLIGEGRLLRNWRVNISDSVLSRNWEVMWSLEWWGVWKGNTLVEIKRSLRSNIRLSGNMGLVVVSLALMWLIYNRSTRHWWDFTFLMRLIERKWSRKKGGSIGW